MWSVSDDPVDFDEAIAAFRELVPMTDEDWASLSQAAKGQAFKVAGVAQLDVVTQVWEAVEAAITEGTDFRDFVAAIGDTLTTAWSGTVADPAWRMETIFRTNLQKSYNHGRYKQATDPDTIEDRPYWMFDAVMDNRTTDTCEACNGTIRPADDGWWSTRIPPLHFNCRSTLITLTEEQAEALGGAVDHPPKAKADDGFGDAPDDDDEGVGDDWDPDSDDYPSALWDLYKSVKH